MSNYDLDEIERKKSQKQKKQWRDYVDKSLEHPLNKPSKSCQQWDAQSQSYIEVGNNQDNLRSLHEDE